MYDENIYEKRAIDNIYEKRTIENYLEDDDTCEEYPTCPYDECICVIQTCENCDVRRCYEDP